MERAWRFTTISLAIVMLAPLAGQAQQAPPIGIEVPPLSSQPYRFDTAEQHDIEVTVLAKGFARPFALDFLPNGDLLLAERGGGLRMLRGATTDDPQLLPEAIEGMPLPGAQGTFGLHDIAIHPDYAQNGLIYWTWNIPAPDTEEPGEAPDQGIFTIMRGRLTSDGLADIETIFEADHPSYPAGTRIAFGHDGKLYATTGAPFGDAAQDGASPYGKVLRLNDDGSVPSDNPFVGGNGMHPAVYSYGHRDQHGLAVHPETGQVFSAEHGPNGGDEVNLIQPGDNYGWPGVSFGRNYDGTRMDAATQAEGVTDPLIVWLPSIAPSGLMFYQGDQFPAWKGNLFVGSARRGEVDHTGGLERVVFNDEFGELRRETLLTQLHQRVRDMVEGPDGNIYVLTDGPEHTVLRIEPAA